VSSLTPTYDLDQPTPRVQYAVEQVARACAEVSCAANLKVCIRGSGELKPEGFILTCVDGAMSVTGADQSGVLYGCLELADRIRERNEIPANLRLTDAPEFKLRGPAIGMQKLGGEYLWPYTPENFPFFYNKEHWLEYLDFLASIRMNAVFLWNGHPFASLVQLDDYPEALEVSPEVMKKNREVFSWLTAECDKRGVWLIQNFYNIHLPKALGLGMHLRKSHPKAADYTRKSIAKFVEEYPNVGIMPCLGEALSGKEAQVEWFTETIIPGVMDGLKARGQTELPPLVVRGHHIVEYGSHKEVFSKGLELYPNLFSMVKYNGESLTSETPRGKYQQYHKDLAKYSSTHMANVHILANLEPFRYGDFSFIRNSCKAIRDRLDGNGLHLYPLNYWEWPICPDTDELKQIDRDRLWFQIWARYSWKLDRDPTEERNYWISEIAKTYGNREAAEPIFEAYDAFGECAPRILRRFGITGGNRQCMSLGMFLEQLTDPKNVWQELYDSDSPLGETITQYIAKEFSGEAHIGETPVQVIDEIKAFAAKAVEQIKIAAPYVTANKDEFELVANDIRCVEAMTNFYCTKVEAAMMVHRYRHNKNKAYMQKAFTLLEESLVHYKKLANLTKDTYRYACGFVGRQQIPIHSVKHWVEMVPKFEQELVNFKQQVVNIEQATSNAWRDHPDAITPWPAAEFTLLTEGMETYTVEIGAKVFTDQNFVINDVAPYLIGLIGIRFSRLAANTEVISIDLEVSQPLKVLVGYFQAKDKCWLQVPALEHVSHANDRGGHAAILEDVVDISVGCNGLPKVNLHAFRYKAGKQTLEMIGTGSYVILGVVPDIELLTSSLYNFPN